MNALATQDYHFSNRCDHATAPQRGRPLGDSWHWKREPPQIRDWPTAPSLTQPGDPALGPQRRRRALAALEAKIAASRRILALGDDWDDQGSPGYREDTWRRAVGAVKSSVAWLLKYHGLDVEPPKISPGPEGSIDIHWKTVYFELLINVPNDADQPADFYGDNYGRVSIKGTFDPSSSPSDLGQLLLWLTRR